MLDSNIGSVAAGAVTSAAVALLTVPSASYLVSNFREPKLKSGIYHDEDGMATEETMAAFAVRVPKIVLSIFAVLGLSISIALAVVGILYPGIDGKHVENWINVGTWVCLNELLPTSDLLTIDRHVLPSKLRPLVCYEIPHTLIPSPTKHGFRRHSLP